MLEPYGSHKPPFHFGLVKLEDLESTVSGHGQPIAKNAKLRLSQFLQSELKAEKHTRYIKNDGHLPAFYLYSIRDHDKWREAGATVRGKEYQEYGGFERGTQLRWPGISDETES